MSKYTKQNISNIARKLFSQKGFDACSMDYIAEKVGANKATIYYHFKNKAALYDEVLKNNLSTFLDTVVQAVEKEDKPEKKLYAFALSYAENFTANKTMAPLMLRELASDGAHLTDTTRSLLKKIIILVDNILAQGMQTGVFRETKTFLPYFMMVGSMNIYTATPRMRKTFTQKDDDFGFSVTPKEAAAEIFEIVMNGIQTKKDRA